MNPDHNCGQGETLGIICTKIAQIQSDILEIKDSQKEYLEKAQQADVDRAKYPTPDVVNKQIAKIGQHDTYFKIIWAGLGCAWGVLLVLTGIIVQKLFLAP